MGYSGCLCGLLRGGFVVIDQKQDISNYSDDELSMLVFNNEGFYRMRNNETRLIEALTSHYIFTDEQLDVLKKDLEEDKE